MKQQTIYKHNSSIFGVFDNGLGGISYFDTVEPEKIIEERFDLFPFKIVYKIISNQTLIESGCESNFILQKSIKNGNGIKKIYLSKNGNIEVEIIYIFAESCCAVRAFTKVTNLKDDKVIIEKLTSCNVGGIAGEREYYGQDFEDISVYVLENIWSAEGKVREYSLEDLNMSKIYKHAARQKFFIGSSGSHTTKNYFPIMMLKNKKQNKIWFFQYEPVSAWIIQLSIKDSEALEGAFLNVETFTSDAVSDNWHVSLGKTQSYSAPFTVFGAVNGDITEAVYQLAKYRRKYLKKENTKTPLVFNDYMNCHWTKQNTDRTLKLAEAVSKAGGEVFCLDSGWYKNKNDNWFGKLGDWEPSIETFSPQGLQYIIDKIKSLGMECGLWLEIECCTKNAEAANYPDSWFLTRNGIRIYEIERYFFDFSNALVRDYLKKCIKKLYDMGIRYFKNDYNANLGFGCDYNGICSSYGLERQFYYIKSFFDDICNEFKDLIIENCGSGGMREDYFMLSSFDLQSISDCENYKNYPPIINGTLINILPEHCGIWCMPYPQYYHEKDNEDFDTEEYRNSMADGEQTIFNVISGMMGVMYLSGRIDKADKFNFNLLKEGIKAYKKYRNFINTSYAIFPYRISRITEKDFCVQGLKNGNIILLAVFRRGIEKDILNIKIDNIANVNIVYPLKSFNDEVTCQINDTGLEVKFTEPYQARLYEIEIKK